MAVLLDRGDEFFKYIQDMFPPNTEYLPKIWEPLFDTIKMSLIGSVLGSFLAIPFAVLAASNIVKNRIVLSVTRVFLSLVRTLPTLVVALIATYVLGLGTLAGTTAITIFTLLRQLCHKYYLAILQTAYSALKVTCVTPLS